MRILIVEDDFGSRRVLHAFLKPLGNCDVVIDGEEAIEAFRLAWEEKDPYQVIFLDIMLPKIDGQQALKRIRAIEKDSGIEMADEVKVIMTTALGDPKNVVEAYFQGGATTYLVKPITRDKLYEEMEKLSLITAAEAKRLMK